MSGGNSTVIPSADTAAAYVEMQGDILEDYGFAYYMHLLGGTEIVEAGGVATGNSVQGGLLQVDDGGAARFTYVGGSPSGPYAGILGVKSGGVTYDDQITSGGEELIGQGGTSNSSTISTGGISDVSGVANNATVEAGGVVNVMAGGVAVGAIINSGTQNVNANGVADGSTVQGSLGSDGFELIGLGGVSNGAVVKAYGVEDVYSGGVSNNLILDANGYENVYGVANHTTVNTGGVMTIYSGGLGDDTLIDGGWETVYGSVFGSTVEGSASAGYGFELLESGVIANNTTVNSYGVEDAYAGASTNNSVVNAKGTENVFGAANGTVINQGGEAFVFSGGDVNNTTIAGGSLEIHQGGIAYGLTRFVAGDGGLLLLDQSSQFNGTVSGFGSGDTIDFRDIVPASESFSFSGSSLSGVLLVSDSSHSAAIHLLGNYATSNFIASADGFGGTFITEVSGGALALSQAQAMAATLSHG